MDASLQIEVMFFIAWVYLKLSIRFALSDSDNAVSFCVFVCVSTELFRLTANISVVFLPAPLAHLEPKMEHIPVLP